jgi:hypothetical protein
MPGIKKHDDYEVGYRRPPVKTQFKPGRSGNPKGRSKGSKGLTALLFDELSGLIMVTEDGRKKTMTKGQALIKSLVTGGLKGDVRKIAMIAALSRGEQKQDSPRSDEPLSAKEHELLREILPDLPKKQRR